MSNDHSAAIEAAIDRVARSGKRPGINDPSWYVVRGVRDALIRNAQLAVEAAAPLIEAEVRRKIAEEIESLNSHGNGVYATATRDAAAIARGGGGGQA